MHPRILRPDSKGRITLGALAADISGFAVTVTKDHRIILDPLIEIPASEKWLFDDKISLKKIRRGLADAKAGKLKPRGGFAKYADDEIE